MSDVIERVMAKASFVPKPSYEDYVSCDLEVRRMTEEFIK
jgi:1-deoxy-D-xylulose-5-phosphate reductoisomerase